jgi:hypothetical protein
LSWREDGLTRVSVPWLLMGREAILPCNTLSFLVPLLREPLGEIEGYQGRLFKPPGKLVQRFLWYLGTVLAHARYLSSLGASLKA